MRCSKLGYLCTLRGDHSQGEREGKPQRGVRFPSNSSIWDLCRQIWIFYKFFPFQPVDNKHPNWSKIPLWREHAGNGGGVVWINWTLERMRKKDAFFKQHTSKSLEKNKALSSASLGVYFFSIPLLFAAPGRGGNSRHPPLEVPVTLCYYNSIFQLKQCSQFKSSTVHYSRGRDLRIWLTF